MTAKCCDRKRWPRGLPTADGGAVRARAQVRIDEVHGLTGAQLSAVRCRLR
ncbi:hypothetical protein AB0M46_00565 [Dactylosporangium sp. NPDC051485]|uniref:hypothetical protein n=1 Tax=Dactylosporangium sp. NPDC051485 TaxID=3154846 RepID=UPI0034206AEF